MAAIVTDLPMLLLFSSFAGASVAVTGLMLMFGAVDSADFDEAGFTSSVHDDWWWYAVFLVLAIAGAMSQSREVAARVQKADGTPGQCESGRKVRP